MKGTEELRRISGEFAARVMPVIRELRDAGMSLRRIAQELTDRGVATMRGGHWSAMRVRAMLLRETV